MKRLIFFVLITILIIASTVLYYMLRPPVSENNNTAETVNEASISGETTGTPGISKAPEDVKTTPTSTPSVNIIGEAEAKKLAEDCKVKSITALHGSPIFGLELFDGTRYRTYQLNGLTELRVNVQMKCNLTMEIIE